MEQHEIYKGLAEDLMQECLSCKVPKGCKPSDDRCGRRIGVKYGLYPKKCLKTPSVDTPWEVQRQILFGFGSKEEPLFTQKDNMTAFAREVAQYSEPCMAHERWDLA